MSNPRTTLCLSGPLKSFTATPCEVACHVTTRARSLSLLLRGEGPLETVQEDRRIGLNMNYSIIFTEISFSPETLILLQIIQIIHMILWIMPEFDREGRAVCQFWLQGGKHNVTPTDTDKIRLTRVTLGTSGPPHFLRKGGDYKVPRKNSLT